MVRSDCTTARVPTGYIWSKLWQVNDDVEEALLMNATLSLAATKAHSLHHISIPPAMSGSCIACHQYLPPAISVPAHQVPHPF